MLVKERNKVSLPSREIKTTVALVYPNVYEMGMSSYTIHLLFSMFNNYPGIRCERFFLPKNKKGEKELKSVDTGSRLRDFDVIAFSIHYELDYTNVLWVFDSIGIPLLAKDREVRDYPLVVAGGSAVKSNPLILSPFTDIQVIGDLEPIYKDFCGILTNPNSKNDKLLEFCALPNVLVSKYAQNVLEGKGTISCNFPVKKVHLKKMDDSVNPTRQLIPQFQNPANSLVFGETFLLEINRGCPSGCRFCLTGYVNRPFRNRSLSQIQQIVDDSLLDTSAEKITLIGSAVADHPQFFDICRYIVEKKVKLMIPSIRIDRITPEILDIFQKAGIKSLTVAPESGTDRLRRKVNKTISNSQILEKCDDIYRKGFSSIKFYFLVGLPFETLDDVNGIIELINSIRCQSSDLIPKRGIRLSINPFIPKMGTPFENYTHHFIDRKMEYFKKIEKTFKNQYGKDPLINLEFLNWKEARTQVILSLLGGDFSTFLIDFYKSGALPVAINRLDKENGNFITNFLKNTAKAFDLMISAEEYSPALQSIQHKNYIKLIHSGFKLDYLFTELKKAQKQKVTSCFDECHNCGIC